MNNNKRFLVGTYAVECLNSKINTSSKDVEKNASGFNNITFTKKINNKAYVSAACVKKAIKDDLAESYEVSPRLKSDNNMTFTECNPYKNIDEDMFGFMSASKQELTEEEYKLLDEVQQKLYKKSGKKYTRNMTVKRVGKMQMNGLVGVGTGRVGKEFGVAKPDLGDSVIYATETYSDILVGLMNVDIDEVGKYNVSSETTQFRDYNVADAEILGVRDLDELERKGRIKAVLEQLRLLNIKSNQSNYLTDTMPKIVVLAEYKFGNNVMQGLIQKDGIDIERFDEIIEDYDDYRISDIYIGVSNRIANENFVGLKKKLEQELSKYEFVHITSVKKAFDSYIEHLEKEM